MDERNLHFLETMSDAFVLLDTLWHVACMHPQAEPDKQYKYQHI